MFSSGRDVFLLFSSRVSKWSFQKPMDPFMSQDMAFFRERAAGTTQYMLKLKAWS